MLQPREAQPFTAAPWSAFCYLTGQSMQESLRIRILTVEDEPAVAEMVGLLLGGPGSKIFHACDGWMALMKIGAAKEPFDLIITDHRMPRMNGLDLVRRLRVREFAGKIMVLSAHLSPENILAYEELKVDMMFAKPFDCEELRLATELLIKKPPGSVAALVS